MTIATPSDLASFLQKDVDTSTATLAIAVATSLFESAAATKFTSTAATYTVEGRGQPVISIPREPLIAVVQVRIAGAVMAATEYTVIGLNLYRVIGWGRNFGQITSTAPYVAFPPELVEVDFTYGYTTVPDDVKGAVLETAGAAYQSPDITVAQEQIDDYMIRSSPGTGGFQLSPAAMAVAERYRAGGGFA